MRINSRINARVVVGRLGGAVMALVMAVALAAGAAQAEAAGDEVAATRLAELADGWSLPAGALRPRGGGLAALRRGDAAAASGSLSIQNRAWAPTSTWAIRDYWDMCGDGSGSTLDLRTVEIAHNSDDATLGFYVETCDAWSSSDLTDAGFIWLLGVPGGRGEGPDYAVTIWKEVTGLEIAVHRLPSDNPATWTETHTAPALRADTHSAFGFAPITALDGHTEFLFFVDSYDNAGREDYLPEPHEAPVFFPDGCVFLTQSRASVTTAPGLYETAVRAAAAAGYDVVVEVPQLGAFEVAGVATGDLPDLGKLQGVADARRPGVFRRHQASRVPNDPSFPDQWSLPAVEAPQAWASVTESGLSVAVIDDGVDGTRTDLAGRVLDGRDTLYNRTLSPGLSSDRGGHGTAVSGVLAAAGDNGVDIAGLDWGARIVPYRVFDAAMCTSDAAVAAAITNAADRGVSVINMSIGGPDSPVLRDAITYADSRGVVVVVSVGNDAMNGNAVMYPAAYAETIGVGASTRSDGGASYSSTGPHVDLVAPGGEGSGTAEGDIVVLGERKQLDVVSGTSFAAPLVAGAVTLYRATYPQATPADVRAALLATAVGDGRNDVTGHGVLDVAALLGFEPSSPPPPPIDDALSAACPVDATPPAGFADVPHTNVHARSIDCVVWWEIARGLSADSYGPGQGVTRAQMASFMARMIEASGGALPAPADQGFTDIVGNPHADRINQLAAAGVVAGTGPGTYSPSLVVTRAQMATFLVRAYEYRIGTALPPADDHFSDDNGNPHEANINKAAREGFTSGVGDDRYDPSGTVRRDQMASFIGRTLNSFVAAGFTPARQ